MTSVANKNSYCVVDKRVTGSRDSRLTKTKNNRYLVRSVCTVCNNVKTRFVSATEGEGLLSMLGIKTPLAKIPILGSILG